MKVKTYHRGTEKAKEIFETSNRDIFLFVTRITGLTKPEEMEVTENIKISSQVSKNFRDSNADKATKPKQV